MEANLSRGDPIETNALDRVGKIEDVDLADAITELKTRGSGLQAALSAGSWITSLSLVDFLR